MISSSATPEPKVKAAKPKPIGNPFILFRELVKAKQERQGEETDHEEMDEQHGSSSLDGRSGSDEAVDEAVADKVVFTGWSTYYGKAIKRLGNGQVIKADSYARTESGFLQAFFGEVTVDLEIPNSRLAEDGTIRASCQGGRSVVFSCCLR